MDDFESRAASGKVVSILYTLTSSKGEVLDSSGPEPMAYLHGYDNIVPGLEAELAGKQAGDKLRAVVQPADGYGEILDGSTRELPRDAFPPELLLKPGVQLAAQGPDGELIPLWIAEVKEDCVVIDLNHPLAGEVLTFDVEVVGIRDATEEERDHGHPHSSGSNCHH